MEPFIGKTYIFVVGVFPVEGEHIPPGKLAIHREDSV